MIRVRNLLDEGVAANVAPLMRLEVMHQGKSVLSAGNAHEDTLFDLASVTKVMSTTACALSLVHSNVLRLDQSVGTVLGDAPVASATLEDLLFHRSGLPPFRPFFAEVIA